MHGLAQACSCVPREEEQRGAWQAVHAAESAWSLDDPDGPPGARRRLLLISLAKPPLTETEVTWKKGPHAARVSRQASVPCAPVVVALSFVVDGCQFHGFSMDFRYVVQRILQTSSRRHVAHTRPAS